MSKLFKLANGTDSYCSKLTNMTLIKLYFKQSRGTFLVKIWKSRVPGFPGKQNSQSRNPGNVKKPFPVKINSILVVYCCCYCESLFWFTFFKYFQLFPLVWVQAVKVTLIACCCLLYCMDIWILWDWVAWLNGFSSSEFSMMNFG